MNAEQGFDLAGLRFLPLLVSDARKSAGFSLVEVVVAIGILAFAIVAVIGLLSVGLKSGREAMSSVEAAHAASVLMSSWQTTTNAQVPQLPSLTNSVSGWASNSFYVSDAGLPVVQPADAAFRVEVQVDQALPGEIAATVSLRFHWPSQSTNAAGFFDVVTAIPIQHP
jgi:uncharacterized protein (TIGR02598 family)